MMSDKHKNTSDEYQFPHEEYVAAESDAALHYDTFKSEGSAATEEPAEENAAAPKASVLERFPILQNKRVLAVVGVAFVALIGFKIMSPSHSVTVVKQAKPVVQQSMSARQEQQDMLVNKLNHLSQDASSSQGVVNQLQSEVSQLKTTVNQSDQSNKAMKEALIALAQQVESLSAQVQKATTLPGHLKKLPPSPKVVYHLRAIVAGRAWVEGSNGESDSVTVGTHLKNYGTVRAIDADDGMITTSSGKTITYNNNGN